MVRGERRDLKKESFWREMVRGQSGSGMSVRAWCRRHALRERLQAPVKAFDRVVSVRAIRRCDQPRACKV